jgi:chaperonin GroES
MPLKPLGDRVIARVTEAETTTAGGIVLPDAAREKPQRAQVVAVGPGRQDDDGNVHALDVKEGDTIVYARYGGTDVKVGGEELVILSERDILAVVNEEK